MNIDAAVPTFIAESRELLREMEAALLACEHTTADADVINAIFRAAHTIKGSAGLFGFAGVVDFTHVVEGVLDRVRAGSVLLDAGLVAVLLECRDHIEALVTLLDGSDVEGSAQLEVSGAQLLQGLRAYSDAAGGAGSVPLMAVADPAQSSARRWDIAVRFHADVLRNGMDPLSFIRYLGTLGTITALAVLDADLPEVGNFDAESCYLGFRIELESAAGEERIAAAFEFVREDCTLHITPHAIAEQAVAAPASCTPQGATLQRETTASKKAHTLDRSLRVDGDKLDGLIDRIGELVTAGATMSIAARKAGSLELNENALRLGRLVEEVRDLALKLRMVQIGPTFARFQRVVRDVARELGKDIRLEVSGHETELDRTLIESVADPLMHLVRNAIDHGIETAEVRCSAGKDAQGVLRLNAYHDAGSVVIEVSDDGSGLSRERILAKALQRGLIGAGDGNGATLSDAEVHALIFEPGFSTADQVTNLSGRGVGMDVVKRNIMALRGSVELDSAAGRGTVVRIRLPLTLAIIDGFLVGVGGAAFVIPLELVEECVELGEAERAPGSMQGYANLRGAVLPFIRLRELFAVRGGAARRESIVVIRCAGKRFGIVVDDLLGELQVVIKPLSRLFSRIRGVGGSTILGTGQLALVLDVPGILEQCLGARVAASHSTASQGTVSVIK